MSLDSATSHRKFREKECLPFDLLVDADRKLCRLYEVPVTNFLLARIPARVTFVIGKNGRIIKVFDKVSPKDHASEALAAIDAG